MFKRSNEKGFTLIELLLVVVIIGILLAVIVPRAWRANVDSKYSLVRQNASELASFASQWAEGQIEASDLDSTATVASYFNTLSDTATGRWVANTPNWAGTPLEQVTGRIMEGNDDQIPETTVEGIVPPERVPRNPFNGASVFISSNNPATMGTAIPGALACGSALEGTGFIYYALVFQGTDSTNTLFSGISPAMIFLADFLSPATAFADPGNGKGDDNGNGGSNPGAAGGGTFHAGMGLDLAGLRNGVFMARLPQ